MGTLETLLLITLILLPQVLPLVISPSNAPLSNTNYYPIVLWHGMGAVKRLLEETLPGVLVTSIRLGNSIDEDRKSGWLGDVNEQISEVCEFLSQNVALQSGFNAIGFSQGGLFLRAYVQRCNNPPVRTLVTLGSPHNGVADVPESVCRDGGFWCSVARGLIQKGAYLPFVQHRVVQASYYKDPRQLETYLTKNLFLPDMNNERSTKSVAYKSRLTSLEDLVLVSFANDTMVVPKETAWFGEIVNGTVKSVKELESYQKDYLGLKTLDEEGKLHLLEMDGDHLQIDFETFVSKIIHPFLSNSVKMSDFKEVIPGEASQPIFDKVEWGLTFQS